MPNWYHDRDLTTEQADYLEGFAEYRTTHPVLWALLCGIRTSRSIAARICWPHDDVLRELRRLKHDDKFIYDTEGRRSVEWHFNEDETEHLDYQRWYRAQCLPGGLFTKNEG